MPTGPGHNTRHLATWAGDLSWQTRPDEPPACRTPTGLPERFAADWHRLFDAPPDSRPAAEDWARIRAAIDICRAGCPVRDECLRYALDPDHRAEGVWGGFYFPSPSTATASLRDGLRVPQLPPAPGRRARGRDTPAA